jgi:hypothetical protein
MVVRWAVLNGIINKQMGLKFILEVGYHSFKSFQTFKKIIWGTKQPPPVIRIINPISMVARWTVLN